MKALTLWQPYATLWAAGVKRNETRTWVPNEPVGRLAIHAAKLSLRELERKIGAARVRALEGMLYAHGLVTIAELPRGAIVGAVSVLRTVTTEYMEQFVSLEERDLGDYSPGRAAWIGAEHMVYQPLECAGRQRLWEATWLDAQDAPRCELCSADVRRPHCLMDLDPESCPRHRQRDEWILHQKIASGVYRRYQ